MMLVVTALYDGAIEGGVSQRSWVDQWSTQGWMEGRKVQEQMRQHTTADTCGWHNMQEEEVYYTNKLLQSTNCI